MSEYSTYVLNQDLWDSILEKSFKDLTPDEERLYLTSNRLYCLGFGQKFNIDIALLTYMDGGELQNPEINRTLTLVRLDKEDFECILCYDLNLYKFFWIPRATYVEATGEFEDFDFCEKLSKSYSDAL